MKPVLALPLLVYRLGQAIFSSDKLALSEVQTWITRASNRSNYGRGYSGNRLATSISKGFVELRRESVGDDRFRVIASVVFDPRQGAATSKTWEGKTLDNELKKMFGRNMRVRLDI